MTSVYGGRRGRLRAGRRQDLPDTGVAPRLSCVGVCPPRHSIRLMAPRALSAQEALRPGWCRREPGPCASFALRLVDDSLRFEELVPGTQARDIGSRARIRRPGWSYEMWKKRSDCSGHFFKRSFRKSSSLKPDRPNLRSNEQGSHGHDGQGGPGLVREGQAPRARIVPPPLVPELTTSALADCGALALALSGDRRRPRSLMGASSPLPPPVSRGLLAMAFTRSLRDTLQAAQPGATTSHAAGRVKPVRLRKFRR